MQIYVELNEEERTKLYGESEDNKIGIFKIPFDELEIDLAEKMVKVINDRLEKRKKAILNKLSLADNRN